MDDAERYAVAIHRSRTRFTASVYRQRVDVDKSGWLDARNRSNLAMARRESLSTTRIDCNCVRNLHVIGFSVWLFRNNLTHGVGYSADAATSDAAAANACAWKRTHRQPVDERRFVCADVNNGVVSQRSCAGSSAFSDVLE